MSVNKIERIEVRNSAIHGRGVFATRRIRKGTRIIEYTGERISHDEGDQRYDVDSPHVLLFIVDDDTVIDAARGGNDARFINHSCHPNCEAIEENGHIYIYALRTIREGEELAYDYQLSGGDSEDSRYPCRCGAANCRGTMVESA